MVEALNDDDFVRDGQVTTEVGEALNVSVMSPCGDLLVAVVVCVGVWCVSGCARYRHIRGPESAGKIKAASFSPDGWRMVTITIRNVITVWGLGSDWAGSTFCPQGRLSCCGFLPDGVQVLTIAGSEVSLWSVDGKVRERTSVKKRLVCRPCRVPPTKADDQTILHVGREIHVHQ